MARALAPLWTAAPGRFAGLDRTRAALVALALLLLIALFQLPAPAAPALPDAPAPVNELTDLTVYENVIHGLRAGGDYYELTADTLRAGGYPLRPFLTFRLPGHSVVQATLPPLAAQLALYALAAAVVGAWWWRLADALARPPARIVALILLAGSMTAFVQAELIAFHEIWAGLLVALSVALRQPGRWLAAVAIAVMAMLVRETAALFVLVMAGCAWIEGERREAIGWGAALGLLAAALAAHAWGVGQVTGPLDPASPGWLGLQGPGFFADALARATALQLLPGAGAALLAALTLVGWASWRDPLGFRTAAMIAAYAVAIALFARPDTFYWALMIAPVCLAGLVFVPDALRDIAHALLDRRRVRVHRITP